MRRQSRDGLVDEIQPRRVEHIGISKTYGRFNDVSGHLHLDMSKPANSAFDVTIQTGSINTNNQQRDDR
ncbi:MAG: YceI family protein [Phycisphaeraceae bacterium]|nr:YceI family protein [Phycisphaeraceae bacterium]MDP7347757.1 YceI family protein [Phycisphaeraceae bacterium]